MHELAFRHCEMVRLMMRAAYQQSDEAEAANMLTSLRISGRDGEHSPLVTVGLVLHPLVVSVPFVRIRRDHSLNRVNRPPASPGDRDFDAAVDRLRDGLSLQRDFAHVDEMLAQRFKIDLRPVGFRIGFEDADNLLDGAKGILAGHRRNAHVWFPRLHHFLMLLLHHVRHLIVTRHAVTHCGRLLGKHGLCWVDKNDSGD